MNTQRLMAKYSANYSAGVTDVLDSAEFSRLRQEVISPQDKIMGTLEQVATSRIITHTYWGGGAIGPPSLTPSRNYHPVGTLEQVMTVLGLG